LSCLGFEPGLTTYRLQGDLGVLVLVVYLKPAAENTRNLTNTTTDINSKLPLLFEVHEIWSVDLTLRKIIKIVATR